jgi:hydrogenase-4 membrane subunit HyfE
VENLISQLYQNLQNLAGHNPLNLLEMLLVVAALLVTISESVNQAIRYYKMQTLLLAIVTTVAAISKYKPFDPQAAILILFIALLPALLYVTIRPLLYRATLVESPTTSMTDDFRMIATVSIIRPLSYVYQGWQRALSALQNTRYDPKPYAPSIQIYLDRYAKLECDAEAEWLNRQVSSTGIGSLLLFPLILLLAFLVPSVILSDTFLLPERIGLSVSLALHLLGLYNMIIKRDTISQVIGLLIMDQGLYLAVVKIVEIPVPATLFVISLYFYTLITIFVLVILLPEMTKKTTKNIDLTQIARDSNLKSSTQR